MSCRYNGLSMKTTWFGTVVPALLWNSETLKIYIQKAPMTCCLNIYVIVFIFPRISCIALWICSHSFVNCVVFAHFLEFKLPSAATFYSRYMWSRLVRSKSPAAPLLLFSNLQRVVECRWRPLGLIHGTFSSIAKFIRFLRKREL